MCNRFFVWLTQNWQLEPKSKAEIIHILHFKKSKVNSSRQTLFLVLIMRGSETDLLSSTIIQRCPFLSLSVSKKPKGRWGENSERMRDIDRHRTKGKEFDWKKLGGKEQNKEMQQNSPAHPPGVWRKNCEFAASPMDRTETSTGLQSSAARDNMMYWERAIEREGIFGRIWVNIPL